METTIFIGFLIANCMVLAINLMVLGFTLKLYTEYFKDKSIGKKMGDHIDKNS